MSDNYCFRVDSSGDTNNLIFESLYKTDVPEYLSQGTVYRGNALRLLGELLTSKVLDGSSSNRFFDSKVQRQLKKSSGIPILKDVSNFRVFQEFEPLHSDWQEAGKLQETLVMRTTRLNAEIDKDPCNEQLWLQLLDLQNLYYDFGLLNKKSLLDKKVSIIIRALEKIPNSEDLLLRYIGIMVGVCDNEAMLNLFRKALHCCPNSFKIHLLRLRFVLSSLESFSLYTMENICREAFDCLGLIYGLYFIILFVRILAHAGWSRKALGIYQAIVEFFCFRIDNMEDFPVEFHRIRNFGERNLFILFWKSFTCRIGEKPRCNWTDWVVVFLKTVEKHYEQISQLEEYDLEDSDNESSASSLEELKSPPKLPSVEEGEGNEQEWMDSDASSLSSQDSEASSIDDKAQGGELDYMLTSHSVGNEFNEWILDEKLEFSKTLSEPCSIEQLLQHEDESWRTLFGNCAENYCLPRDIAHVIPQSCNIDKNICYQMVIELLLSLRGWPFLDSITTLIPCDLQNIQLKEEILSNSFSLTNPRDIEQPPYYLGMSLFCLFEKTWPNLTDVNRLISDWLLGNSYSFILGNTMSKENIPITFISNVYDSLIFSKASIFHYSHLRERDPNSLRIAEAFIIFEGVVGGFSKSRSVAKRLLKTCDSFSLYTVFAELLLHLDMLEEAKSIYNTCLNRLDDSDWREKDCCRPILSFLIYHLNHADEDWKGKKRNCQRIYKVFIGKYGSSEDSFSLTEMMMIKNKLQKLASERLSLVWNVGEEMQHFSVFACQLLFEWLCSGLDRARDVLLNIENDVLLTSQRNECNESVYSIVVIKLRQLLCLFSFFEWQHASNSCIRVTRSNVEEALEKYPGDELLLFMYSVLFRFYASRSIESSFHVFFSRLMHKPNVSAMTAIAQIVAEGGSLYEQDIEKSVLKNESPSIRRRVTSLLTRCLYETNLACSSFLWRQYLPVLHAERQSQGKTSEILKKAFYRALTHIPYSKALVLMAFEFLSDTLSTREAKDIWSITSEKGILFKRTFPYEED